MSRSGILAKRLHFRHVIELYSVLAEESSVSLSVTMPDAPLYVSAHKGRLQQMLGNILDNALKFTSMMVSSQYVRRARAAALGDG